MKLLRAAAWRAAVTTWTWIRTWLPRIGLVAGAIALAAAAATGLVVLHYESGLPGVSELRTYQPPQVTRVLARDGTVLAELFTQRRTVVAIAVAPRRT